MPDYRLVAHGDDPPVKGRARVLGRLTAALSGRTRTLAWNVFQSAKPRLQRLATRRAEAHLFVFGCQRSGTTHMERLFRADPRSVVFGEFSALSTKPGATVWRPLPEVADTLSRQPGHYTVARSLFESDRASSVIDAIPGSAAVWVYRDAPSVVRSMVVKWADGFRAVSEHVETGTDGKWRLSSLWDEIEDEAAEATGQARPSIPDVYALYWLRRNECVLEAEPALRGRLTAVSYDRLGHEPDAVVAQALSLLDIGPPRARFPLETTPSKRASYGEAGITSAIADRCEAMLVRLDALAARTSGR